MKQMHEARAAVGSSPPRKDGPDKVTGRARYLDDLTFEGQLWGATIRSKVAHARLLGVEFDESFDWTGITRVTAKDIPGENVVALIEDDQPMLVHDLIRHREEPVALLACEDRERLEEALQHVQLKTEPLPPVFDPFQSPKVFKSYHIEQAPEGLREAFVNAHKVIEGTYKVGHQEQMYIEPQAVCAIPRADGGVTIYGSMQCPFYIHKALKKLLHINDDQLAVIQVVTGGGFGGKEDYPSLIAGHASLLALKAKRPVKMIYKREEDVAATTKRHPAIMKYRTAVTAEGEFLACEIDIVMDGGAYVTLSPVVASRGVLHAAGAYKWRHASIDCRVVQTNTPPNGAFRGFGVPQTIFAIEAHVEKIAHELGIDPLELRRRNVLRIGDELPTGQILRESVSAREVLDAAAAKSSYAQKRAQISEGQKRRGIGISLAFHGAGFTGSGEVRLNPHAGVELTERGARVLSISTDIGQGAITVFAQMAADALGLPVDDVDVAENDTSKMPDSGPTVASRTTMVVGGTITKAAQAMQKILCEFAGADGCRDGIFTKNGRPLEPFAAVAKEYLSNRGPLKVIENYRHPEGIHFDDATYRGDAYPCYGWAATAVEVEVDTDTYETTLVSVTTATDVGKAIHPVLAQGQVEGGTVQALGYALLEEHLFAPDGRMLNTRMQNYVIPTALDIPPMQTLLLENAYAHGPYGAKGLGELPMDGPAPAVLAAVLHATGKLVPELPISPDRLMRALL